MLKNITVPHLESNFFMQRVENWDMVKENKTSFVIDDNPSIDFLRFPGLVFSSEEAASFYNETIYKDFYDIFTPPRGNLSTKNSIIILGIKPGICKLNLNEVHESAWLFGPSSKILHKVLEELNIYPYFTNVYKNFYDEENHNFDIIIKELMTVIFLCDTVHIISLGNYSEYDEIKEIIDSKGIDLRWSKIWHPSYILRKNAPETFNKWKKSMEELIYE